MTATVSEGPGLHQSAPGEFLPGLKKKKENVVPGAPKQGSEKAQDDPEKGKSEKKEKTGKKTKKEEEPEDAAPADPKGKGEGVKGKGKKGKGDLRL